MKSPSIRAVDLLVFLSCCTLLLIALYLQMHVGLAPCPLCVIQRFIIMVLGLLFLVGAFLNPYFRWRKIFHFMVFLVAATGITAAGRQVWLQNLPPEQIVTCGATLSQLLRVLPAHQALLLIFKGTGECAEVTWRFLGFSMASWTLFFFSLYALLALWQTFRKPSQ